MRVRILKTSKNYRAGEVLVIDSILAYKLIDAGVAEISKDMTPADYRTHGKTTLSHNTHKHS